MTSEQRRLVHESWARASVSGEEFARCFYARLFEIDAEAARLFTFTDMAAQRAKFVRMLSVLVRAIDEPRELVPGVAALGRRHVRYGASRRHYASVGEALRGALAATLGAAFTPAVHAAWVEAYALVESVMRRAVAHPEPNAPDTIRSRSAL